MKRLKPAAQTGQVSMEYAIIFAVVLAAIFATGIIDRTRNSFRTYFTKASETMTMDSSGSGAGVGGRGNAGSGEVAQGQEISGNGDNTQTGSPSGGIASGVTPADGKAPSDIEAQKAKADKEYAAALSEAGNQLAFAKEDLSVAKREYEEDKRQYNKLRAFFPWIKPYDETDKGQRQLMRINSDEAIIDSVEQLRGMQ